MRCDKRNFSQLKSFTERDEGGGGHVGLFRAGARFYLILQGFNCYTPGIDGARFMHKNQVANKICISFFLRIRAIQGNS